MRPSIESGNLAHAYLIVGEPRGSAQALAEAILALLYCKAADQRPCGQCRPCRQTRDHQHPDLMWLEPQKKSRTIQKEQIEALQQHMLQSALEGGWKVVVLVNADRLNPVAGNRLLKILEEPPPRSLFLLLTDSPDALLPTVLSRCQRLLLPGHQAAVETAWQSLVVQVVTGITGQGMGAGVARAHRMMDGLKALRQQIEDAESPVDEEADLEPELRKDLEDIRLARIEGRWREARAGVLRALLHWYRDLLLCVCGVPEEALCFRVEKERLQALADQLTYRQALHNIRTVEMIQTRLEQQLPEAVVWEWGFSRLSA